MVKIALTIQEQHYGGASKQVFWILEALCANGLKPILITNAANSWLGTEIRRYNLPVKIYQSSWIQRNIHPIKDGLALGFISYVLLKEKPDILLMGGAKLVVQGAIAGWICRTPRRIAHIHGLGAPPESRFLEAVFVLNRLIARLGTAFITVSDYDANTMIDRHVVHPKQVTTIRNGIDIQQIRQGRRGVIRERFKIPEEALVITMVGRFTKHKRYDQFLTMMEALCETYPQVYGLLAGDGPMKDILQARIDSKPYANRIILTGFIDNIADVYADNDISVLLTDFEGLPNSLTESTAAGLPIIASHVCGIPEVVHHGQNGFLVHSPDDAIEFAKQLIENTGLRNAMGQNSAAFADQDFDHRYQINQVLSFMNATEQTKDLSPVAVG